MAIAVRTLSSLEKVFPDEELTAEETASLAALRGERVSFQIACRALDEERVVLRAHAQCALSVPVELYEVGLVPVTLPCYRNPDGNYLRTTPGLYPDPLYPHREEMRVVAGQWRCLWVSLTVPEDAPPATCLSGCGCSVPIPSPASRRRSWQRSCSACMCCPPACPRRS